MIRRARLAPAIVALAVCLLLMGRHSDAITRTDAFAANEEPRGGFAGSVLSHLHANAAEPGADGPARQVTARITSFAEAGAAAGLDATHTAQRSTGEGGPIGAPGQEVDRVANYPVTGQAWGDFDRDGWVDLYVTDQLGPNTLYHNTGHGTFAVSPLSEAVSLPDAVSGGAVFADYDNDGWLDLYVLGYEQDILFRNRQGEAFVNVTELAEIDDGGRGMTASWGDYDRDGWLDLYVANYGCLACDPFEQKDGDPDRLYHNEGDGTFTDATSALPARRMAGWGFVAGWLDYDNDRDLDLYLVNDVKGTRYLQPNALLRNDGPGCGHWCFADVSEASGAGVRVNGMGLAVGDYDGDQNLDLFMSNLGWTAEAITGPAVLLRNQGDGSFVEVSRRAGADVDAVGWGTVFLDYDNDGWQDLYVALGFDPRDIGPWVTANRLLRNRGDGTFEDVSATSGASYADHTLGVAAADYNGDGWIDLVTGNFDEGYALYASTGGAGQGNHRLVVRLEGGGPVNRDAVGARVYLTTPDGRTQVREIMAGSSLGAGNDLALHFGLGPATDADLRVVWPDGQEQSFLHVPADVRWQLNYKGAPVTTPLLAPSGLTALATAAAAPSPVVDPGVRTGGYLVPVLAVLATLVLAAWLVASHDGLPPTIVSRLLFSLVFGVCTFQLAHFVEHVLQLGYWMLYPGRPPWITPWGRIATDGLAALSGHHGGRATGTELLHLSGNWITFMGIAAAFLALRAWGVEAGLMRAATFAFWLQLVHVTEHLSLTTTFFAVGTPIGLSTLLGRSFLLEGAWAPSIRIWWHFMMVVATTALLILSLRDLRRARSGGCGGFGAGGEETARVLEPGLASGAAFVTRALLVGDAPRTRHES